MNPDSPQVINDLMDIALPISSVIIGIGIALSIMSWITAQIVRAFETHTKFEIEKPKRKVKDEYEPPDSLVDETSDGELVYWDFEPANGKRKNDDRD